MVTFHCNIFMIIAIKFVNLLTLMTQIPPLIAIIIEMMCLLIVSSCPLTFLAIL